MINETKAKKYCREDIALIENYSQAVADAKTWDCHHRAETDEKLTHKELKAQDRYWNRPASELVFLTRSAHKKLHFAAGTLENQRGASRKNGRKYGPINSRKSAWKRSKAVMQFQKDGTFVKEWPSIHEITRQLGFNQSNICQCCNGQRKYAKGFIWRYK